jgi:hypothetical protein
MYDYNDKTLYCPRCGGNECVQYLAWVNASTGEPEDYAYMAGSSCYKCYECEQEILPVTIDQLYKMFQEDAEMKRDKLVEDWLCFEEGTTKEEIQEWFKERNFTQF